jgi:hypothetical protein
MLLNPTSIRARRASSMTCISKLLFIFLVKDLTQKQDIMKRESVLIEFDIFDKARSITFLL